MKKLVLTLITAGLVAFGAASLSAQTTETAPKSLIHVVTVSWKEGTTPEQVKAALDGAQALPAKFKGITRVWTRSVKIQGDKTNAIVMEFADEAALKAYAGSDAQKEWYTLYQPIRQSSTTFDISN